MVKHINIGIAVNEYFTDYRTFEMMFFSIMFIKVEPFTYEMRKNGNKWKIIGEKI